MWEESGLDLIKSLHKADTLIQLISSGGIAVITAIVFAETGLLAGFFLPGDSLLITAGVIANPANPNHLEGFHLPWVLLSLNIAAIVGNQTGFFLGRKFGQWIEGREKSSFFLNKKHLKNAQGFYQKYGVFSIIAARFIPIFRTFVPFSAGAARMPYRKFLVWDLFGGTLWIQSLVWIGYYLGQTELANRLDKIILLVIIVSTLPVIITAIRAKLSKEVLS